MEPGKRIEVPHGRIAGLAQIFTYKIAQLREPQYGY